MTLKDWIKHEGRPTTESDLQRMWDAATFDGEPEYCSWRPPAWATEPPAAGHSEEGGA